MNDNEIIQRLDLAYKQYLQILRPYLAQVADQNILDCCNSWLQRLSSCTDEEKKVRNQYILTMCCQLSKGNLNEPFNKLAPVDSLENFPTDINSDTTSDLECDCNKPDNQTNDPYRKGLFQSSLITTVNPELTSKKSDEFEKGSIKSFDLSGSDPHKKDAFCCALMDLENCPNEDETKVIFDCRATNLIIKLREIKKENVQLHKQITALKREMNIQSEDNLRETSFIDNSVEVCLCENFSETTVRSLKSKLKEMNESRNKLIETIGALQEKLDHYEEMKKHEIEDIKARHKLDIINIKTMIREECSNQHKATFAENISNQENQIKERSNSTNFTLFEELKLKEKLIEEMRTLLKQKDEEANKLRKDLELQKEHLHSVMEKYLEKTSNINENCNDGVRNKAEVLEKQLNKMEKSKMKSAKLFESRLAYLQREKHLSDTTYQLQLIRQRAQITSEMVDESQVEVNAAMKKLETKFKEIVANVQATAIKRRIQDQKSLEVIMQTMKELKTDTDGANKIGSQHSRTRDLNKNNASCFCQGDKNRNLVFDNESIIDGFCLDSEKMVQLFNKIYIPQRDATDASK